MKRSCCKLDRMRDGDLSRNLPIRRHCSAAAVQGPTTMSDATHGLPIHTPDPDFGRAYQRPEEVMPQFQLSPGWWMLPMLAGGVVGWAVLLRSIFF